MNFDLEKAEYDSIEIPKELHTMVNRTIARDKKRRLLKRRRAFVKMAASVAALLVLSLTVGVNSSYAFARTVRKVPVVGPVAEVLTVRKYEAEKAADEEYQRELLAETITIDSNGEAVGEILPIAETEEISDVPELTDDGSMSLEKWIAGLSAEKLSQVTELYRTDMEELYADTPEKLDTILLAQIPEKDTYLYGYHHDGAKQGVALRMGDKLQYFGWTYMNDTHELPDISYVDMNDDGKEELVVLLYNTSMTEVKTQTVVEEEAVAFGETESTTNDESGSNAATDDDSIKQESDTTVTETSDDPKESTTVSGNDLPESDIAQDNAETVSGNDIVAPETEDVPKRGELWVVCEQDGQLSATVLTENDFSSQILHQLKADYLEEECALQFYLQEEPLGDAISLYIDEDMQEEADTVSSNDVGEESRKVYEKTSLDSHVRYEIGADVKMYFRLGIWFENEKEMDTTLIPEFVANITFSGDIFTVNGIEFKKN